MRFYVTADPHGFYSILRASLDRAGFFSDKESHKLIVLGDLLDRGEEAIDMQDFILNLMEEDRVILIRGNHEDLFESLVTEDQGVPYRHHVHNGTFDTAMQLTGFDSKMAGRNHDFAAAARRTPYYTQIIPATIDYYETEHYVFVHGWIPAIGGHDSKGHDTYNYVNEWREASNNAWRVARWYNGMDAVETCMEEKTIVCGHWHTSYGHVKYENKGSEFGPDADFSPYYGNGIIALDACTAHSGRVNVITLEDKEQK